MTTKKLIEYRDRLRAIEKTIISQFMEEWAKLRDLGNELDEEIAKQKRKEQRRKARATPQRKSDHTGTVE